MFWTAGQQLNNGKYVIDSILGQGGFGVTYKARHVRLNHLTVIKTPNPFLRRDREYARYVERFIKEAQLLAELCANPHPHIVQVSDFFEQGDMPCLVMEYIPGENLSDAVERKGALPETEAVEYIRQVGGALAFIHQANLVHRDAHPGNIIVLRPDRDADLFPLFQAILIDFGLAGEILPISPTSQHFANERFAPYEQKQGSVAPTVDVYCLAASLYYAVTREYPATSWDRRYHSADLVAPQQHNPRISKELNQAILAGMALEPENRPQSMGEWLQMLVKVPGDDLSSARGIDYNKLRNLLASGNWKEADKETAGRMLEVIGKEGWLHVTSEDIGEFPYTDLCTIDTLWVKHSNGRFGFSVQKRIWESVGGKLGEWDYEIYKKFATRVGWLVKEKHWMGHSYSALIFSLNAPLGHLPLVSWEDLPGGFSLLSHRDL